MFVISNWKANGSKKLCHEFIENFRSNGSVVICPPVIFLDYLIKNLPQIPIGAQDCSAYPNGSHTGDVTCEMLKDIGVKYVIIGHSERVKLHKETIEIVINKVDRCLENDLVPIVCVDENYQEKMPKLSHFSGKIIVAYEPVSSIGTGVVPSNKEIENAFKEIKSFGQFRTLYGGSVNSKNISNLIEITDLDGVLVGGASLAVSEFQLIVDISSQLKA